MTGDAMKKIYILILLAIISCKKEGDRIEPDLTTSLVGVYSLEEREEILENTFVDYEIRWTIKKTSNNTINIETFNSEEVTGEFASYVEEPGPPFETTLDNIELDNPDGFKFDRNIDWPYDGEIQKSHLILDGKLIGKELRVHVVETTLSDNDRSEGDFVLTKQ
jgi:hypothetical protein